MEAFWSEEQDVQLGLRLQAARHIKGLSLAQVAERMGVSKATVGHWETGKRTIKHQDLAVICTILGVSADELLFGVRRWPFEKIDFVSVAELEPSDLARLEGSLIATAAHLGIDIEQVEPAAPPSNVVEFTQSGQGGAEPRRIAPPTTKKASPRRRVDRNVVTGKRPPAKRKESPNGSDSDSRVEDQRDARPAARGDGKGRKG